MYIQVLFNNQKLVQRYMTLQRLDPGRELQAIQSFKSAAELEQYLVRFGGGLVDQLGDEIDRIVDNIMGMAPEVKHVHLEVM